MLGATIPAASPPFLHSTVPHSVGTHGRPSPHPKPRRTLPRKKPTVMPRIPTHPCRWDANLRDSSVTPPYCLCTARSLSIRAYSGSNVSHLPKGRARQGGHVPPWALKRLCGLGPAHGAPWHVACPLPQAHTTAHACTHHVRKQWRTRMHARTHMHAPTRMHARTQTNTYARAHKRTCNGRSNAPRAHGLRHHAQHHAHVCVCVLLTPVIPVSLSLTQCVQGGVPLSLRTVKPCSSGSSGRTGPALQPRGTEPTATSLRLLASTLAPCGMPQLKQHRPVAAGPPGGAAEQRLSMAMAGSWDQGIWSLHRPNCDQGVGAKQRSRRGSAACTVIWHHHSRGAAAPRPRLKLSGPSRPAACPLRTGASGAARRGGGRRGGEDGQVAHEPGWQSCC